VEIRSALNTDPLSGSRGGTGQHRSAHTHDDMETLHRSCWWSRGFLKLSVDHSLVHV